MPSRLLTICQWPHGNSCTCAHETVRHVSKCMSYHGAFGWLVITERAHCLSLLTTNTYYAHLTSVRFEHSVCCESLLTILTIRCWRYTNTFPSNLNAANLNLEEKPLTSPRNYGNIYPWFILECLAFMLVLTYIIWSVNSTYRCLIGLRDPTLFWGSWWPSGQYR